MLLENAIDKRVGPFVIRHTSRNILKLRIVDRTILASIAKLSPYYEPKPREDITPE